MILIHPTAIVNSKANLDSSVKVGPYSIIDADVSIGAGSVIGNHVTITGNTTIGKNNYIYHYSSIGESPQDKKYNQEKTFLEIGDNNTIREFCTFNRGTAQDQSLTKIGNDNWIMAYVHLAHDCEIKNHTILANNTSLAGHVTIDDYAILGGFTLVHQFCKIGSHIITAVNTVVFKDIPPYIIAAGYDAKPNGINVEGLKRRGFDPKIITKIKEAYKILYRKGLSLNEAEAQIKLLSKDTKELNLYTDFIAKSTRGIIR
ncbi:MAG: acyl-ACP--UDP-N-acetylglucosamine O-acyltransferase [Methylophilaceae bacterium]|nr:acyl-ACP--UDP-N-acetylglucosamine O-acyltransferase [Methylophilaceae bacterium]NDF80958.1 acyl-ACP--UDP-N-acetylglucosamine O-acyltransferase [Methylophilaceae bacterium]